MLMGGRSARGTSSVAAAQQTAADREVRSGGLIVAMGSRSPAVGPVVGRAGSATVGRAVAVGLLGVLTVLVSGCSGSPEASGPGPSSAVSSAPATPLAGPSAVTLTASPSPSPSPSPVFGWLSGASSDEAAKGTYGTWRGAAIQIGGTWDNGNAEQVEMRTICPGGPWATWNAPLDVAVGAIDVDAGESWQAAAAGAYTARWRAHLTRLRQCWGTRDPALLYIRFAHEMNLPQKWRVRGGQEADFVKAITLYSNLRYELVPGARLVLCPNDGTDAGLGGLDIRKLWPGHDAQGRPVADIYAVDSYNAAPHVTTAVEFRKKINASYPNGMPLGLEKHRQLAQKLGVPFAVAEWSNNGDPGSSNGGGESPVYLREFNAWLRSHSGNENAPLAGQVVYEVHFNLLEPFAFWPRTVQPQTAATYRSLTWGH